MSRAEEVLKEARRIVAEQAEDSGLWFQAKYITEAGLQAALRRLHAVIEDSQMDKQIFSGCTWPHHVESPICVYDRESFDRYCSGEYKLHKLLF